MMGNAQQNSMLSLADPLSSLSFTIVLVFLSSLNAMSGSTKSKREVISMRHATVATDDFRCSRIGIDVLCEGGNVVDASVAAVLRLGVVNPALSGLRGGAFMFIRLASGEAHAFDLREIAPLPENMYAGNETLKGKCTISIAISGELAGLHEAWKQHGRLPWERLVKPTERLARLGFKISPYLHMQMVKMKSGILADEGLHHLFTLNGSLLKTVETCCNMKLAETLSQISKFGPIAFYNASIGSKLVRGIQKLGGILTMKDLQNYKVKLRKPVSADTLGLKILTMPPPSGGPLMIHVLEQRKSDRESARK